MTENYISRRILLKAGLSVALLAAIPMSGLSFALSNRELDGVVGASSHEPYKSNLTGQLSEMDTIQLKDFAIWVISAWEFSNMESYPDSLTGILKIKTNEKPSYLEEYRNAALLIEEAKPRFNSKNEMFIHLLFNGRDQEDMIGTRLGRARQFVFDEIIRHIVANGGFRRFGFVNYKGYIGGGSFYDSNSYRREII